MEPNYVSRKQKLLHLSIVAYKGLLGIAEIVFGFLLLAPITVGSLIERFAAHELSEDPQDIVMNWILAHTGLFQLLSHLGLVLIFLGSVKFLIAVGLWKRSYSIMRFSFWLLILALLFGVYTISKNFSVPGLVAILIDGGVLVYLWKLIPRHMILWRRGL